MKALRQRWVARFSLLLLPLLFAYSAAWLTGERGPLWLGGNSDPSYQYLLNSLLVLDGHPPHHVDHPGTTVQVLGATVLRMMWPDGDSHQRTVAVLKDPETALNHLHWFFLGLMVLTIGIAGIFVFERTGSLTTAWTIQLVPLLQPGNYRATLFVDPEALLAPLTLLFVTVLVIREHIPETDRSDQQSGLLNLALGLLAGAAVVTKVTFAPLCLLPLLVQRSWRGVLCTLGAMVLGIAVYLVPIYSELPRMFRWFRNLATHTGIYGGGATGFIDAKTYVSNVWTLATTDRIFLVLGPAAFCIGCAILMMRPIDPRILRRAYLLVVAAVVQGICLLLVAKHSHPRYLLPVAISGAFNATLLVDLAWRWPDRKMVRRALAVLATGAIVAMGLGGRDVVRLAHELRTARDAQLEHTRRADVLARGGIRVDYYRSSSMEFALYFGNSTAWHLYGPLLAQLYPQRIFFNIYGGVFEKFSRTLAPEEVFGNGSVFLVGNALEYLPPGVRVPIPAGWEMTLIDRNGDKTVHQLQPKR